MKLSSLLFSTYAFCNVHRTDALTRINQNFNQLGSSRLVGLYGNSWKRQARAGLLAAGGEWMTAAGGLQEWYRKPWYRNPVAWNASNLLILC